MEGVNFVEFKGILQRPKATTTNSGIPRFQATIMVPTQYKDKSGQVKEGKSYNNISAWRDIAESLGELPEGTAVHVQGVLQTRSYDGNCKSCGAQEKKYWTDVLVDSFLVLE